MCPTEKKIRIIVLDANFHFKHRRYVYIFTDNDDILRNAMNAFSRFHTVNFHSKNRYGILHTWVLNQWSNTQFIHPAYTQKYKHTFIHGRKNM